jgi:ElaB/YqjD/DUF883 family membrane-anchored ribosome-binding protein
MGQSTEELTTQIEDTRGDLARDVDALTDRVSPSRMVERRKAAARGRMRQLRSKVMGTAHSGQHATTSTAQHAVDTVSGTTQDAMSTIEDRVEGSPLAAGVIAFGAGMVLSALIPASDAEAQAAQKVVDTAKEHGQPVMDEAKSVGQEMGENLKQSATEAGQQVKDTAQQSAEHVKAQGQSSAQEVKSETRNQM